MGMPCEVNSILKLRPDQGFPETLKTGETHKGTKEGYRILLIDVPIMLVGEDWKGVADVIINKITWENDTTTVVFKIDRIYKESFTAKEIE